MDWLTELANAVTDPYELFQILHLNNKYLTQSLEANKLFKLKVPHHFLQKIEPGNMNDPLLKQIIPNVDEFIQDPNFIADPLAENEVNPLPGLLHKYHGRALIIATSVCPVHCRYCFRREFEYREQRLNFNLINDYLLNHPIDEIILSGGDPLSLSNEKLNRLIKQLDLTKINRIRIHSRMPVILPQRIDREFLKILQNWSQAIILVVHINHPNEIDTFFCDAMHKLKSIGVTLLNQSVLLKDINDNAGCLQTLSNRCFSAGVLPYYLHQLDQVKGSTHFAVSQGKAIAIHKELQSLLPGYLVPKLVQEIAGEKNKALVN